MKDITLPHRIANARDAFSKVYASDQWSLGAIPASAERIRHLTDLFEEFIRAHKISSVAEYGCGFWNYTRHIDWTGKTYDGYDVVPGVIEYNSKVYGTDNVRFHLLTETTKPAPADLLICKDVLQHLPPADIIHYLALFRETFRYSLIINDIAPEDNTNGEIPHGGYHTINLAAQPFNANVEIIAEWDAPDFGINYRKQCCLLS